MNNKNNAAKALLVLAMLMPVMASANNLGEDRAWQFKAPEARSIQMTKLNLRDGGRLGDARRGAGNGGGFGGSTIGNNVIINYNINGDNNTIANNTNTIEQDNNGDQQSNVNYNSDGENHNGGDRKP